VAVGAREFFMDARRESSRADRSRLTGGGGQGGVVVTDETLFVSQCGEATDGEEHSADDRNPESPFVILKPVHSCLVNSRAWEVINCTIGKPYAKINCVGASMI